MREFSFSTNERFFMWSYTLEKWDGQAALATGPCRLASDALFRTRPFSLPFEVVSSTFIASFKRVCYYHGLLMKGGLLNE